MNSVSGRITVAAVQSTPVWLDRDATVDPIGHYARSDRLQLTEHSAAEPSQRAADNSRSRRRRQQEY